MKSDVSYVRRDIAEINQSNKKIEERLYKIEAALSVMKWGIGLAVAGLVSVFVRLMVM